MVVRVRAPAKINLGLRILRRRPDGFHDIDTVFQAVSLFDTLELREGGRAQQEEAGKEKNLGRDVQATGHLQETARREVVYKAPDGLQFLMESPWDLPADETNLAVRAARLAASETGCDVSRLRICLSKRIPPGGGLAGGSTDAAGVLAGLNSLWNLKLPEDRLLEWGARLGSDVPFCQLGGTARGEGRGEILTPIRRSLSFAVVIAKAEISVPTALAYRAFDPARHAVPGDLAPLVRCLEEGRMAEFIQRMENTFALCLDPLYPDLRKGVEALRAAGCQAALLSGSGASVWGLCDSIEQARAIAKSLKRDFAFVEAAELLKNGPEVSHLA